MTLLPAESLLEAKSRRQTLQEAFYHVQQARQEARNRGQSRQKPDMTDSPSWKQKLEDQFIPCDNVVS